MVERTIVGAHYGLSGWLAQRVTAVVMALYCIGLAGYLLSLPYLDYDTWTALFFSQWMRTFTLLFLLSLFLHAWIGVRDVVMDNLPVMGSKSLQRRPVNSHGLEPTQKQLCKKTQPWGHVAQCFLKK